MKHLSACLALAAAFSLISTVVPAKAEPLLTAAAWKTKPGWGIVIASASHSVYESHPKEVAAVIAAAARDTRQMAAR